MEKNLEAQTDYQDFQLAAIKLHPDLSSYISPVMTKEQVEVLKIAAERKGLGIDLTFVANPDFTQGTMLEIISMYERSVPDEVIKQAFKDFTLEQIHAVWIGLARIYYDGPNSTSLKYEDMNPDLTAEEIYAIIESKEIR